MFLALACVFVAGFLACYASLMRADDALERVIDGKRGARWQCGGWFFGVLLSASASAGALTYAIELLRH